MIVSYIYIKYLLYLVLFVGTPVVVLILLKIIQRFTLGKCRSLVCLFGKTAIITGGSTGIGYQTALHLAARGCKVIIADKYGSLRAAKKITRITNNANVFYKYLDLSSLKSVRKFAEEINGTEEKLDILIYNADVTSVSNNYTEDGLHETMQKNHFGPFLLTHLLVDLLKKAAPSRIIFVSSAAAFFSNLSIENLNYPKDHPLSLFRKGLIYGNSKLCNVIAANGFAKRLEDHGITCNSLHPGWVYTKNENFSQKKVGLHRIILRLISFFYGKTPREGAQTTLYLAMSKSLQKVSGKHFWDCVRFPLPLGARNEKFCQDIWKESEVFVRLNESEKLPLPSKIIDESETSTTDINKESNSEIIGDEENNLNDFEENKSDMKEAIQTDINETDIGIDEEVHEQKMDKENGEHIDNENILRFRKINDTREFVNMNETIDHNEAKERS